MLSTLLIPLQPRGPPSSCFLSFLLLPLQGFCTYFLCLECSSPRHTQLIPSGLYINIIFSVGPCLATYNRLKIWPRWWYITILWQHHDVQAERRASDMAGSRGPKDICETRSLSLCFLDTLSRYYPRINTSREQRESLLTTAPDNSWHCVQ